MGEIIIGLAKMYLERSDLLAVFMFIIGGLLIIGGILFKISLRKNDFRNTGY